MSLEKEALQLRRKKEKEEKEERQKEAKEQLQTVLHKQNFNELAARKKTLEEKDKKDVAETALTPYEMLVVAIGETLEFFIAHEKHVREIGATITFYEHSNGFAVPEHYVEACKTMENLLEKPSITDLEKLVELASKIYGHRSWEGTIAGSLGIIAGIVIALELPVLALILGTAIPLIQIVVLGAALVLLAGAIFMLLNSAPSDHSAELYKVKAAAEQLPELKPSSFISSFFALSSTDEDNSASKTSLTPSPAM